MESRKRKSELESYIDSLTDPPEKQKKSNEFYNSLRQFYKRRWNAVLRPPCVQGVEVNLYRLYDTVMALGGWQKVAHADKWSDIAEMFGCKEDIVCGDHAIKLIYMRYLSKFEQVETIGDVDDYVDNEMSRSRGRNATSFFATNDCPISYNRMHPEQPPRDERGQIITDPDYARLVKSLISGLPNEVDFAMNVCMLLSHAGPKQLKLCHAPTLLTLLVAHTGVYDEEDETLQQLGEDWKKTTRHNYRRFWASSGVPLDMLMRFIDPEIKSEYVDDDDAQFFTGIAETFNVKDAKCWRLNQVTTVIRNLCFEPANRVTIVNTWPVMKFLFMCASCKWSPLYVAAYDAFTLLAADIDLTDNTMIHVSQHAILRIVHEGIYSPDKFKFMRSMEILAGLCTYEGNEATILDWIKPDTIAHIFKMFGVRDIMMCVYTLECLYSISEMGDTACDLIAESPTAIQQLVSMATLEAVSYGATGLAGMKVVEYQPGFTQGPGQGQQGQQGHQPQQVITRGPPMQAPPPQQMQAPQTPQHHQMQTPQAPPMTVRQVIQNNLALQQVQRENMQREQLSRPAPSTPYSNAPPRRDTIVPVRPIGPSSSKAPEVQRMEEACAMWVKKNVVFEPAMCTPRGELYAAYVDDMRNLYNAMSATLSTFSSIVKSIHPDMFFKIAENGVMIMAQGIRFIRPHVMAPVGSYSSGAPIAVPPPMASCTSESHPLMSKMLNNSEPTPPPMENGVGLVNGHSATVKIESSSQPATPRRSASDDTNEEEESTKNSDDVETEKKPILLNGTVEVCQEPIQASKLFNGLEDDENTVAGNEKKSEVAIEIREQFVNSDSEITKSVDLEDSTEDKLVAEVTEKVNGIICNGHTTTKPAKRESVAQRAAHLVAAVAACNGNLEKLNGNSNETQEATTEEKEEEAEDKKPEEEEEEEEQTTSSGKKCVPQASEPTDYMCDWDCCSKSYASPAHVLKHLTEEHVVEELRTLCRWNCCSDPTPRNRWSLITHIQDSHCNEAQLKQSAQLRKSGALIPRARDVVPRDVNNHPGYAKNAAFDAIRRHAFTHLNRELTDEAEGPVTKSIRLAACLILRNLARYSADGRQKLRRHESHICWLALSRLESSICLSQLLAELHQAPQAEEEQLPKTISAAPSSASLSSMAGSSSQLPTIPESPTTTFVSAPSFSKKPSASISSNRLVTPVNRMLNFSALSVPSEKPSTSSSSPSSSAQFSTGGPSSSSSSSAPPRHHPIQQHLPSQPSPLVQTTTPVRAGAGI